MLSFFYVYVSLFFFALYIYCKQFKCHSKHHMLFIMYDISQMKWTFLRGNIILYFLSIYLLWLSHRWWKWVWLSLANQQQVCVSIETEALIAFNNSECDRSSPCVRLCFPGDSEEGVAVSLAVPSTSPPSHGSPGGLKETATPPSSPSMGGGLVVQGWVTSGSAHARVQIVEGVSTIFIIQLIIWFFQIY